MRSCNRQNSMRKLIALVVLLGFATSGHSQQEEGAVGNYPDWSGQWSRIGSRDWAPEGYEEAGPPPLTEEYQAIWERYSALQDEGIPAGDPTSRCLPPGMPRMMKMPLPMEVIVKPDITYIYGHWDSQFRRVYTDGRDWPDPLLPTFNGYSIGEWQDENLDGVYDVLSVETRGMTGPRAFDHQGVPLHANNETVVRERMRLVDEARMANEITTIDDALTQPWTIEQRYGRETEDVIWQEHLCIGSKRYMTLGDAWYIFDPVNETLERANSQQPRLIPRAR